jgi:hypothetical protein
VSASLFAASLRGFFLLRERRVPAETMIRRYRCLKQLIVIA